MSTLIGERRWPQRVWGITTIVTPLAVLLIRSVRA